MITDEEAYGHYFCGEEEAAEFLIKKYGDPLVFYINGYLKDIQEAEDLMIEAFSNLFVKKRPLKEPGSFKAYLYKTAHNLALRHRQKYRIPFLHLEELNFELQSERLVDTEFLRSEQNQRLYQALGELKQEYREALYLVYFENMSYRNVGMVMGKSETQVSKLIYHGKQNLKTILEQED